MELYRLTHAIRNMYIDRLDSKEGYKFWKGQLGSSRGQTDPLHAFLASGISTANTHSRAFNTNSAARKEGGKEGATGCKKVVRCAYSKSREGFMQFGHRVGTATFKLSNFRALPMPEDKK